MTARLSRSGARALFERGHPVRLATEKGYASTGWTSAAVRLFGVSTFDEYERYAIETAGARGLGDLHWERPSPSRRTQDEAAGHVFRREEFEIGNLSGTHYFLADGSMGDLPEKYQDSFRHADYAVWSYETPIAWAMPAGDVMIPPVRYSLTTTQHQHLVATAFGAQFASVESARTGKGKSPYGKRGW